MRGLWLLIWLWALPVQAMTVQDLVAVWQGNLTRMGLTATVGDTVDTLGQQELRAVVVQPRLAIAGVTAALHVQGITLREQPDGAVAVALQGRVWLDLESSFGRGVMELDRSDLTLQVEAVEGGERYSFAAASLGVVWQADRDGGYADDIGVLVPNGTVRLVLGLDQIKGSYLDVTHKGFLTTVDVAADRAAFNRVETDPKTGFGITERYTETAPALHFRMLRPGDSLREFDITAGTVLTALRHGLQVELSTSNDGSSDSTVFRRNPAMTGGVLATDRRIRMGASRSRLALDRDGLTADYDAEGASFAIGSALIPTKEAVLGVGPMALHLAVPFQDKGPYVLRLSVQDVAGSASLWQLGDPRAVLPREPGRLALDVAGHAGVGLSGFLRARDDGVPMPPLKPRDVTVTRLEAAGFGAAVSALGAFTFAYKGAKVVPEGKATVTLQGAQDLLAGLVRLGAVTADQATALRFGLAAGFDATKTPGELVSQIEARADGSVYVNNARLR